MPTCPACAEQIPSGVATCPHCGVGVHDSAPRDVSSNRGRKPWSTTIIIAVVGVVVGGILLLCCGFFTLPALLLPAVQQAREAARRTQCLNNLKQIGLALQNYHDVYSTFPPAYMADAAGKPMHSWRVLILPFLGEEQLYSEYDFSEPWDGPNNSRLLARMPHVYVCPSDPTGGGNTNTAYAGVFGEPCVFRGAFAVRLADITDGTANTLLVGEADQAGIPWMKPEDIDVTKHPNLGDSGGFSSHHAGGVNFVLCDGSARFIPLDVNAETLKAIFTRNGNEIPGSF
jgi:hypothetical protein